MQPNEPNPAVSPKDDASAQTWESGSELTASVISGSSVWSEGSGGDRSSRRALILQMAKARMKNNSPDKKSKSGASVVSGAPGAASVVSGALSAQVIQEEGGFAAPQDEGEFGVDETDNVTEGNTDIDFSGDLD